MTPAGLRSLFRHHRLRSDVPVANPHRFRHTFGADMVRAGISLPALQHLMGHSQIHTTLLYVQLAPQDVWREYARAVANRVAADHPAKCHESSQDKVSNRSSTHKSRSSLSHCSPSPSSNTDMLPPTSSRIFVTHFRTSAGCPNSVAILICWAGSAGFASLRLSATTPRAAPALPSPPA